MYTKDKTRVIKLRISEKELLYLDSICEITGENKSEAIRKAISERRKRLLMKNPNHISFYEERS